MTRSYILIYIINICTACIIAEYSTYGPGWSAWTLEFEYIYTYVYLQHFNRHATPLLRNFGYFLFFQIVLPEVSSEITCKLSTEKSHRFLKKIVLKQIQKIKVYINIQTPGVIKAFWGPFQLHLCLITLSGRSTSNSRQVSVTIFIINELVLSMSI